MANLPKIATKGSTKLAKSFKAKLSQLASDTKYYYSELKNELLFLEGVKARTSWRFETFSIKKRPIARLNIIGQTLILLLQLNYENVDEKYFAEDLSNLKKYSDTPIAVKVKSERGLKWAKELIEKLNIPKRPNYLKHKKTYNAPYLSTEVLLKNGEIKVIKK